MVIKWRYGSGRVMVDADMMENGGRRSYISITEHCSARSSNISQRTH